MLLNREIKKIFELLKISNSLKRTCKEKQEELDECVKNEKEVDVEKWHLKALLWYFFLIWC